jgi:hypothetical protein
MSPQSPPSRVLGRAFPRDVQQISTHQKLAEEDFSRLASFHKAEVFLILASEKREH